MEGIELEVVVTLELLGTTDERELGAIELDGRDDEVTTTGWPEQLGRTSAPEVLPVKPKVVDAPEPRLPLYLTLVAVTRLVPLPVRVAFQLLVIAAVCG